MDVRSIVRAFRFGEMQRKSEKDPGARRPPTIMFLGLAVALVVVGVVGVSLLSRGGDETPDGGVYDVPDPTPSDTGNQTASSSAPRSLARFSDAP